MDKTTYFRFLEVPATASVSAAKLSSCYATQAEAERAAQDELSVGTLFWIFPVDAEGRAISS